MAIIIRRNKPDPPPVTIRRRTRPTTEEIHSETRVGEGWPYERGFPPDRTKRAYHAINVHGTIYAFLWEPNGRLGEEWSCGRWSCSPGVMQSHDYRGECVLVYRSPSTPTDDYQMQRKRR